MLFRSNPFSQSRYSSNEITLEDGRKITKDLVRALTDEEVAKLDGLNKYAAAKETFIACALDDDYLDFLTLPAYEKMD